MKNLMFVKVDQGVELHPLISVHQYYYTFCYTKGITFNVHPYTPHPLPNKNNLVSLCTCYFTQTYLQFYCCFNFSISFFFWCFIHIIDLFIGCFINVLPFTYTLTYLYLICTPVIFFNLQISYKNFFRFSETMNIIIRL